MGSDTLGLAGGAKTARVVGGAVSACLIVAVSFVTAANPATATCPINSTGLDTSATNKILVVHWGHAWGQVIKADYTQVRSFTVWRRTDPDTLLDPMHLYVTECDSTGRPMVDRILQDGPALIIPIPAEEGKPIEVRYEFDPPLQLRAPGRYWFAVKEDWCDAAFQLLADSTNAYPDGAAWRTSPDLFCQSVGGSPASYGGQFDLIFSVEFCVPTTSVDSRFHSWGSVKAHYR